MDFLKKQTYFQCKQRFTREPLWKKDVGGGGKKDGLVHTHSFTAFERFVFAVCTA